MSANSHPYSEWEWHGDQPLTLQMERPPSTINTDRGVADLAPGPRARLIIEGRAELVARLERAMREEFLRISEEIRGG